MRKKKIRKLIIVAIILVFLIIACDMRLKIVVYEVESEKVNKPVKVALLTDLHSDWYGKNQKTLIDAVDSNKPDVVLLGGDIFDDNGAYDNAKIALEQLATKYPCYYVTGNHEYWSEDIDTILEIVEKAGVKVLSSDCDTVEINGQKINFCGVDDPDVIYYTKDGVSIRTQLDIVKGKAEPENFTILLSHRPELIETYKQYEIDLVLCGHAHGGQWRMPFVLNGLFAPNQGLFPKYAGGRYDYGSGTMIVSRGLARESTPVPRVFNRPELVIIEIK